MGIARKMVQEAAIATPAKVITNGAGSHKKEAHEPMSSRGEKNEQPSGSNVIQVPTWAITVFAIPTILLVVWLTSFWTSTNMEIQALKATIELQRIDRLEQDNELRKDVRLQDAWMRDTREKMLERGIKDIPPVPDISRPRP